MLCRLLAWHQAAAPAMSSASHQAPTLLRCAARTDGRRHGGTPTGGQQQQRRSRSMQRRSFWQCSVHTNPWAASGLTAHDAGFLCSWALLLVIAPLRA